ncbi:hypothetical protein Salat_1519900 [Sesamum alatum]|uniref:CCHC-type domain-containing protein n=1 Tax=Sesamum alatum TaxID=300844 RepID=A0AAE1YC22_9LAMI|nr:hypothetical protein Salat_1519900 [Sesamum alatum]
MWVNAASGGSFMNKTVRDGYSLIEVMAQNQYGWSNESLVPKMSPSRSSVDALTLLADTVDALAQKVDQLDMNAFSANNMSCLICGGIGHLAVDCQSGNSCHEDPARASERGRRSQPPPRTSADYDKLHTSISFMKAELQSQHALLGSMQRMIQTIYDWHLQQGHFLPPSQYTR